MILQLTTDTTLSANWVIAGVLMVLAFLLVRILNRIEKKQEEHDVRIRDVETDIEVLKVKNPLR